MPARVSRGMRRESEREQERRSESFGATVGGPFFLLAPPQVLAGSGTPKTCRR